MRITCVLLAVRGLCLCMKSWIISDEHLRIITQAKNYLCSYLDRGSQAVLGEMFHIYREFPQGNIKSLPTLNPDHSLMM